MFMKRNNIQISPQEYQALLRKDFYSFIEHAFYEINPETQFLPNWHIEKIAQELEECRLGNTKRLIINLRQQSVELPPTNRPVAYVAHLSEPARAAVQKAAWRGRSSTRMTIEPTRSMRARYGDQPCRDGAAPRDERVETEDPRLRSATCGTSGTRSSSASARSAPGRPTG